MLMQKNVTREHRQTMRGCSRAARRTLENIGNGSVNAALALLEAA